MASSLVGDIITTCGWPIFRSGYSSNSVCTIGNKNAAVLPEPVCAHAMISLEASTIGIAFFCIGVGLLYPDLFTLFKINFDRPDSSKLVIDGGQFSPVTYTHTQLTYTICIRIFSLPVLEFYHIVRNLCPNLFLDQRHVPHRLMVLEECKNHVVFHQLL